MSAPPVEASTTRSTSPRRAASSTRNVPTTFASKLAAGSAAEPGTDPAAARCTTASHPAAASLTTPASRMSPFTRSAGTPARWAASPLDRLSSTRTR
jgi:hypothetical protein